jgi:hypothetical protein
MFLSGDPAREFSDESLGDNTHVGRKLLGPLSRDYNRPMPQVALPSAPVYDAVIIGSGAGGGTVTQVLTQMGVSVALLEAGAMLSRI